MSDPNSPEARAEHEAYRAECRADSLRIFELTRATYDAEALENGVYAEVFGYGSDLTLALAPKISVMLVTKRYKTNHSVFDEVLTDDVRGPEIEAEIPEIRALAGKLGLSQHQQPTKGIYRETKEGRSFTVFDGLTTETPSAQEARALTELYGVTDFYIDSTFSKPTKIDYVSLPILGRAEAYYSGEPGNDDLETGISTHNSVYEDRKRVFDINHDDLFQRVADVQLSYFTAPDPSHTTVVEKCRTAMHEEAAFWDRDEADLAASKESTDHLLDVGQWTAYGGLYVYVASRYTIDRANRSVKFETLVNPEANQNQDADGTFTILEELSLVLAGAVHHALSERTNGEYPNLAVLMINQAGLAVDMPVFYKAFDLPPKPPQPEEAAYDPFMDEFMPKKLDYIATAAQGADWLSHNHPPKQ